MTAHEAADDAGVAPEQAAVAAVEAEWYNGNLTEDCRDRLLAALAANLPADDGARAAIKAEALREAADEMNRQHMHGWRVGEGRVVPAGTSGAIAWLRDRADNLAADQHADEAGL